jgi:hypothetical protein
MSLLKHGKSILGNSCVTNITNLGFWVLVDETEYFIPFEHYPCFQNATVKQILDFEQLSPNQLHWSDLDCDIELGALKNPLNFPLKFKR